MSRKHSLLVSLAASSLLATPVLALEPGDTTATADPNPAAAVSTAPAITIQYIRAQDQRGINVFEAPKVAGAPYTGFRLDWGAAFTQQFQRIGHSNTAAERILTDASGNPYNANQLADIGWGFNLATANLALNAQLAPGIRVSLESYMSSRHHPEFWVKGGYLQIDESPIDLPVLNKVMEYVTVRAGMFGLNYGDAHFRRSDNGNAIYNPFVENYIMDAFNTEIGAEIYFRTGPWLAMVGVTDGVNKGGVTDPGNRGPAFLGKLGVDHEIAPRLRGRLTGSIYHVEKTPSNNMFFGDRTGSRYYSVMENVVSTTAGNFTSGRLNPGFNHQMTTFQINPFLKVGGLELFGVIEQAEGKHNSEADTRTVTQYAGDVVYRFLPNEQLYVGARYNTVEGDLRFMGGGAPQILNVGVDRSALAAGWFVTPNVLVKGEYVRQDYKRFPTFDIRNGGKFDGFVIEGVVAF